MIASSIINLISATRIIFTQGIGKNGATVAVSTEQQFYSTCPYLYCMWLLLFIITIAESAVFVYIFVSIYFFGIQDTSVLSPVIPMTFFVYMAVYYALRSPAMMLEKHSIIFFVAMVAPIVKFVLLMMVRDGVSPISLTASWYHCSPSLSLILSQIAGMCKTPLPLFDVIMISPLVAVINLVIGCHVSEYYLLLVLGVSY